MSDEDIDKLADETMKRITNSTPEQRVRFLEDMGEFFCPHCGKLVIRWEMCNCTNDE